MLVIIQLKWVMAEQNKPHHITQDIAGISLHFHIIVQKHKVVGAEEDTQLTIVGMQVMVLMVVQVEVKEHTVMEVMLHQQEQEQ